MSIKVHHLNCGSMCPVGLSALFPVTKLTCHCLLIETAGTLVLVDTGLPREDLQMKNEWLKKLTTHPVRDPGFSARDQIKGLGFDPSDVGHIVLTHLDWDHAGGMRDFPQALVHMHEREAEFLTAGKSLPLRYDDQIWKHGPKVETYNRFGDSWNGFEAVKALKGLPPEILMVPLTGHTRGHCGVAVQTENRWLLHAGDAFFFKEDLSLNPLKRNKASDLLQAGLADNNVQRLKTLWKLSRLKNTAPEVELTNSHDARLFQTSKSR